MNDKIQLKRGTLENWLKADPILLDGEMALVATYASKPTVYDQYKVGGGSKKFSELPYQGLPCLQELGASTTSPLSQKAITDWINKGYQFRGVATPSTNPGTPDGPVFYLASEDGTYSNFNGISVADGEAVILQWNDGAWTKKTTGLATEQEIIYDVSARNDGAVFESLQALLSSPNLSTLIPTSVRHGGMSIRFIQGSEQSSNNKYVQWRYMGTDDATFTNIADWQSVEEIAKLTATIEDKTSEIIKEVIKTEGDYICIEDNNGNEVFNLDENGLDAKNVKSNGKDVLTEQDISGLATKEEVTEKQDLIPQVSQEETTDNEEEAVFSSDDENEVYAKVGSYGIKTKAILDLDGNPIQEEKIILPDYFKAEAVETGNTIKSFATSSATVFNIVTDTHERYWESGDVRAYDMSFENIRNVNKIYKSNALIHLGDILSSNNTNTGKYDSQDVVNAHLKDFFERMRNAHEHSVIMLGNHEDIYGAGGGGDAKSIYPNVAIYDYSCNRYKNRPFFYIDNNIGKIRSIFLCCPYQWEGKSSNWTFGQEQIGWLIDTALNVENDWHCIFFSHTPLVSNDMSSSDYQDVIGVINAFNSHTTFTTSYNKVADFSGKTGTKSVAWICGHEHYDLVVKPKDKTVYPNNNLDCPIIVISCHYRYGASGSVPGASYYDIAYRTQQNANRDLWDTLIYRKDQSKIYMIRFGAGEDRVINV